MQLGFFCVVLVLSVKFEVLGCGLGFELGLGLVLVCSAFVHSLVTVNCLRFLGLWASESSDSSGLLGLCRLPLWYQSSSKSSL